MKKVQIVDNFWSTRMDLNRTVALNYQWEQYEKCGTLGNFRQVAEKRQGNRKGYFYTDSDLHKWADAVSRTLFVASDVKLEALLNEYIDLMEKAQDSDGYLYTWNQLYFPGRRWINIHVEHELYTAGHFIEAGISHLLATGEKRLFNMAVRTADLVVRDFKKITSSNCPGHQEIEIALLKLFRVTGQSKYMDIAEQFLRKRGRGWFFGLRLLQNYFSHSFRCKIVKRMDRNEGLNNLGFNISENAMAREPRFLALRSFLAFISGSYQQQHKALLKQTEPKGHSVRWAYMMYATAILNREREDPDLSTFQSESWENLTAKKMYITGGIGALPVIEGFGRNYELNNEFSYSETCAAIGSIFWNNEMLKYAPHACYADLIERQLYNAASVGISQDGKKYFYRNPLESCGELERHSWFQTACCPSNISRLWGDIPDLIYSETNGVIYINQYIGNRGLSNDKATDIEIKSDFPWEGRAEIKVSSTTSKRINLRIPGWAQTWKIRLNGELLYEGIKTIASSRLYTDILKSASYFEVELLPGTGHVIELEIPMGIVVNRSDDRVKENRGKIALSRGPIVYCIESENRISDPVDTSCLSYEWDDQTFNGRTVVLSNGRFSFIPYYLWGNRGKRNMKVWVDQLT